MIAISDIRRWLETTNDEVLSLYLAVDASQMENQAATPAWQTWLKNALKHVESDLQESHREAWSAICSWLEDFFASYAPSGKTLILFVEKSLQQTYELPILLSNYVSFGEPALTPLLQAINEHKPYLMTLLDHESACIWLVDMNHIEYEEKMQLDVHTEDWPKITLKSSPTRSQYVKAGGSRDRFAHRLEKQIEQFHKKVAKQVLRLSKKYHTDYIVLAGDPEVSHAFHRFLPNQTFIGPIPVAHHLRPSEIVREVAPFVTEYEHQQELLLVEDTVRLAESGVRCAIGTDVVKALAERCVEWLILPSASANESLVDQLTVAALRAGAEVKTVSGVAAERLIAAGGVAARLYYKVPV
jgi:peptide subunit release factor 1 (eRF1)